jgi:hypothetical protein
MFERLAGRLALRVPAYLPAATCARLARRVYAARPLWTVDFDGDQLSFGRAFYAHLERGREREYFARAADSDARVERFLPGFAASLVGAVGALTGGEAAARPGWCWPGVHIFPAGGWLARRGGDVHYDAEGLAGDHAARRAPAITLVLMLQPPERGGELKGWDARYEGEDEASEAARSRPSALVPYRAGDLVVLDSYRLHRIQPFEGMRDRLSATAHGAHVGGQWHVWF